jgi:hypothetical protein
MWLFPVYILFIVYTVHLFCSFVGMELTDDNLRTLSDYLQHTLSPDVNVRRPGEFNLCHQKIFNFTNLFLVFIQLTVTWSARSHSD